MKGRYLDRLNVCAAEGQLSRSEPTSISRSNVTTAEKSSVTAWHALDHLPSHWPLLGSNCRLLCAAWRHRGGLALARTS